MDDKYLPRFHVSTLRLLQVIQVGAVGNAISPDSAACCDVQVDFQGFQQFYAGEIIIKGNCQGLVVKKLPQHLCEVINHAGRRRQIRIVFTFLSNSWIKRFFFGLGA